MPPQPNDPHYDLIVIGSGQAGNPLSSAFLDKGKRVAMIERGAVGGTCVNYGCTPTKTMVASAEVADLASRGSEFGVRTGEVSVDMAAVIARKRGIVTQSRESGEKRFANGIDLFRGEGSFLAPKQIQVRLNAGGTQTFTADTVVIDTGLSPTVPPIHGIEGIESLDNASIMEIDRLPDHLVILGGGYIGVEFAQMFRRYGSQVTLVQHGHQILEAEDTDVAEALADILREDGINLLLQTKATAVAATPTGMELTVEGPAGPSTVAGSHLLVATGRAPNTKALQLQAAGITPDAHGYIPVNDRLETATPGIYAVGDVTGGPQFTHIAYDDYRILKANLLDGGDRVTTGRPLPYCVYTDPQLGRIGLSEKAASAAGIPFKVATLPMKSVARAFETGQTRGFMKAIVDPGNHQILGAAILGADGGEIMSMLEIAIMGKLPYTALRDAIFAHPTFAESLNVLFAKL